jgi:hypothetical protein
VGKAGVRWGLQRGRRAEERGRRGGVGGRGVRERAECGWGAETVVGRGLRSMDDWIRVGWRVRHLDPEGGEADRVGGRHVGRDGAVRCGGGNVAGADVGGLAAPPGEQHGHVEGACGHHQVEVPPGLGLHLRGEGEGSSGS